MQRRTLALSLAVAAALIAPLPGCGGSGSSSNPTPVPTPTPTPAPTRTLVSTGSQSDIPPAASSNQAYFVVVQTTVTATLEATVNWTFASNNVAVLWAQGNCIDDPNCPVLVTDSGSAKPKTVTVSNVAAGLYTMIVVNLGTTNESVSYQIFMIR